MYIMWLVFKGVLGSGFAVLFCLNSLIFFFNHLFEVCQWLPVRCYMQLLVNGWGRVTTLLIVLIFQLDFLPGEVGGGRGICMHINC